MSKKTRMEHTTNPLVHVVSAEDDEHCLAIAKAVEQLREQYRVLVLAENENEVSFTRRAEANPSTFALYPKFKKDKRHHNWGKTRFDFRYINTTKRGGVKIVPDKTIRLLTDATPLKTRQMLELLVVFAKIEGAEDMTYGHGGRSAESVDSKTKSRYFTTRRVNVTIHQVCRLLEAIEAALNKGDVEAAKKIMEQWEDHILAGSRRRKNAQVKSRPGKES